MANPSERVAFTRQAAVRISDAVRKVEAGDRGEAGLRFGSIPPAVTGKVFRIATFTGAWNINALKTVTFKYQTTTPNTVSASNIFAAITSTATITRNCAIAKDGTAWFLIAAECG